MTGKVGPTTQSTLVPPLPNKKAKDTLTDTLQKNILKRPKASDAEKLNVDATKLEPDSGFFGSVGSLIDSCVSQVKHFVVKSAVDFVLDTEKDKKALQGSIPQDDIDHLFDQIKQEVPHLRALIQKMLPGLDKFFNSQSNNADDLIYRCLIHAFANLANKNGANTTEELIENCAIHLICIIGPLLNDIDKAIAEGTPPSKALFLDLADALFDQFFSVDDIFYKFKDKSVDKLAEVLSEGYTPIASWLAGNDLAPGSNDPSPYQKEIDHFAPLILEKVTNYYIEKDKKFLNHLTDRDDFSLIIKKYTPTLCDQVLAKFNLPLDKMGLQGRKDILEKTIEAVILRSTVNLSEKLFKKGMTSEDFIEKVVSHFSENLHLACRYVNSQKKEAKVEHFYQASCSLAELFLPKISWLNGFIERRQERFLKPVAELHHSFYVASYNEEMLESYKDRLGNILRDPTKPDEDTRPLVDQFYHLCHNCVLIPKTKISSYFADDGKFLKLLSYFQKDDKNQLDDAVLTLLERSIQQILVQEDKDISWFGSKIEHWGSTRAFLALICLFEKVPEDERYPIDKLLFKAFDLLLKLGEDQLNVLTESGEENPFTEESLAPVINQVIALFSDESVALKDDADLTLPEKIEKKGMQTIQTQCQSILSKILGTITSWTRDRQASADKLENLFQSPNMLRLFNLGQHMVTQGIPYYLNNKSEGLIDKHLMPKLAPLLSETGDVLAEDETKTIRAMIHGFCNEFGENASLEKQKLIKFLGVFVETASIRLMGDLFERLNQEGLLEDILKYVVEEATIHFKAIGDTKRAVNKDKPSRDEFKKEFTAQGILHPAADDDEASKEKFFDGLADKVFKILGIDENSEFPIPDWTKGFSFQMQEKMLPDILNAATKYLCEEGTINQILLSVLNHVNDDHKKETPLLQRLFPDNQTHKMTMADLDPKFSDKYQTELQQELAKAIEALIKMHPDTIPNLLMRSDRIKAYAAQAVGQPLREQIRDAESDKPISLLTIIDKVVGSYIDEIAPGKIDEMTGDFVYFKTTLEGKIKKDDSDTPIETDAPNLSRFFPKTDDEKQRADKFQKQQARNAAKNVPKLLRHIIDHQTDQIAIKAFIKTWAKFERKVTDKMVAWFGDRYGKRIHQFLLPVLRLLIKYPIALGVLIFNYTVWLVVSQIIKLIFNNQAKKRAQDVAVKIHDNAVLRITEKVIDRFAEALA